MNHEDVTSILTTQVLPSPWFVAQRHLEGPNHREDWFCALVPVDLVTERLQDNSWDADMKLGRPSVVSYHKDEGWTPDRIEGRFGNENGIEPLVIYRDYDGMRPDHYEVAEEFRLFHNLFFEPAKRRLIHIDDQGNESEAVRLGPNSVEIRTDLLTRYLAAKGMALAVYVDSFRKSNQSLNDLNLTRGGDPVIGASYSYHQILGSETHVGPGDFKSSSGFLGKKYVSPDALGPIPQSPPEAYQEFIIKTDAAGQPIRHTCDPERLANYFGKNPGAPHYLTPVFFRPDVLAKYRADPQKYAVEDGILRCGSLWSMRLDNDQADHVSAYLGDLGRDLSESERNYWLSFNIPPEGRKISATNFTRSFMGQPKNPDQPDLLFKLQYARFRPDFRRAHGWDFFLPLHSDDEHVLTAFHLLTSDNQAEFDRQVLGLTKLMVDSLNEAEIAKGLRTILPNDKGIAKLEKFFIERGLVGFEPHIKFIRTLQDLRSTSAAHRKGSKYEKLIQDLNWSDSGPQKVFTDLVASAIAAITYLRANLLPPA